MRVLLCLLLAVGCSSKKQDEDQARPAPAAPPAPVVDAAADERACRDTGDGEACSRAASHAAVHARPEIAFELHELACVHGQAAGCAERATQERTPALWNGMACRRGNVDACGLADSWAFDVAERVTATTTSPGAVGTKLTRIYVHTVADCVAGLSATERNRARTITVRFGLDGAGPTDLEVTADPVVTSCVAHAAARWRFADPNAGPHALVVEVSAAPAP